MNLVQVLSQAMNIAQKSIPVVLIGFAFGFITTLLTLFFQTNMGEATHWGPAVGFLVYLIGIGLLGVFFQSGSLSFIRQVHAQGSAQLSDFVNGAKKNYVSLLILSILLIAIVFVAYILSLLLMETLPESALGLAIMIMAFFALCLLSLGILAMYAPYAIVANGEKVFPALRSSIDIVRAGQPVVYVFIYILLLSISILFITIILGSIYQAIGLDDAIAFPLTMICSLGLILLATVSWPQFRNSRIAQSPYFLTFITVAVVVMSNQLIIFGLDIFSSMLGAREATALSPITLATLFISTLINSFFGIWLMSSLMVLYHHFRNPSVQQA